MRPPGILPAVLLPTLYASTVIASNQQVMASSKQNPLDSDFEKFATGVLEEWHVPGVSIAVVDVEDTWAAVSYTSIWAGARMTLGSVACGV